MNTDLPKATDFPGMKEKGEKPLILYTNRNWSSQPSGDWTQGLHSAAWHVIP